MKYKPGDKVRIKSLDWYEANKCDGLVMCDGIAFPQMMTDWCGKELTIDCIFTDERGSGYIMKEPNIHWRFTDSMIEDPVGGDPKETMVSLDKVCEYLQKNMYVEHIFEYSEDEQPVQYVCASVSDSVEEFVNNFRKAMEE